jgi:signal peptidase I
MVVEDSLKKILRDYSEALVIALVLAIFIRLFFWGAYKIPTDSMYPNLKTGDFILASKSAYGIRIPFTQRILLMENPKRGDVVILRCPKNKEKDCIKRIVALPGDRLEIVKKNLIINGKKSNYEILPLLEQQRAQFIEKTQDNHRTISITKNLMSENYGPIIVPPKSYFILSDARDESEDSRTWGPILREDILAKATLIWFSLDWSPVWEKKGKVQLRKERFFTKID